MKKLLITCFLFLGWIIAHGQSVNLEWARVAGGTGYNDAGYSLSYDQSGNVYTTGVFEGTVDFDPGAGIYNLTSFGNQDIFISKFDSAGNFQWVKQIGGNAMDRGYFIAIRPSGTIYITGTFNGIVDFDPGIGVYTLVSSGFTSFISMLDSNGNFISAQKIANQQAYGSNSIAFDSLGNRYFAGVFTGTVDFDPGVGIYNLTSSIGNNDLFISKYDSTGNFIWVKSIGGAGNEYPSSIVLDLSGNAYLTGTFQGLVDFDPGIATLNFTSLGSNDGFICKVDPSGNLVWAKHIGGPGEENWNAIALDQFNNVYTTGSFKGAIDFDPGIDTFNLLSPSTSQHDIFISKLDSNGNFQWAKHIGGTGAFNEIGYSIAVDYLGNIYTTGFYAFTVDFDPNAGIYNLSGASDEVFILKLDPIGNFIWAKNFGGAGNDNGYVIKVDPSGNIYTTGTFFGTADFDPNSGVVNYSSVGGSRDIFIHKMSQCPVTTNSILAADCLSYTLNGQTYTSSGVYSQILTNSVGCDSILTLNLTINSTASSIIQSSCNSYTLNGQTYTATGTYTQLLTNSAGCDSILTLNLTINSTASSIFYSSCDSYTLNGQTYTATGVYTQLLTNSFGCDSTITLNLTINPTSSNTISQTSCNSYLLNGQTYTATGVYTQTLLNSVGCDSNLTLNLIINATSNSNTIQTACDSYTLNSQTFTVSGIYTQNYTNAVGCDSILTLNLTINTVDSTVTQSGITLTANATGATYKWVKCPSYSIITGETNQSFTATGNGDYAVIVTQSGCTDTSTCYTITGVGVNNYFTSNIINVSPNPTNGVLNITTSEAIKNASIKIVNVTGETILHQDHLSGKNFMLDISNEATGIYFVEIKENEKSKQVKLIKE